CVWGPFRLRGPSRTCERACPRSVRPGRMRNRGGHTMTTTGRIGSLRTRAALTTVAVTAAAGLLAGVAGAGTAQAQPAAVEHPTAERAAPAATAEADPTPEEQQRLREIAGAIWTPQLAAGWNMNSEVEAVLST